MLLDFVETSLSADGIGDLLTMAGFELEGIEESEGDSVLDIKVMSNRGDGLSVFGLAREVLAKDQDAKPTDLYLQAVSRFAQIETGPEAPSASVDIETSDCSRFACLTLGTISASESEPWMQKRLRQAGMRPISLLVDITNYVMLEIGQPLHAFDHRKLSEGRIVVRKAKVGEELTTLNGIEHKLRPDQVMICDADKPVSAAGIMGGLDTEVTHGTSEVLLESAHFLNTSVRRTRKQLGLNTDASYRFERSVDPEGVVAGLLRYVQLLRAADSGITVSKVLDNYPVPPTPHTITLRVSRASRLLGMPITFDQATSYLSRLGFKPHATDADTLEVLSPTWRPDIVREEDLIEELGRVHGYDKIPETMIVGSTTLGGPHGFQLWTDWIRDAALRSGLSQVISHSLCDLHPLDQPDTERIGPRTPSSPDMAYLRNTLLTSLAEAVRRNNAKDIHIFEIGHTFWKVNNGYEEEIRLAILQAGPLQSAGWSVVEANPANFFTLKGSLEQILHSVGVKPKFVLPSTVDPRLHPTRQAALIVYDRLIGFIGQVHPDVAKETGLIRETFLAEIALSAAYEVRSLDMDLHSVSRHPAVRRDMSILIDKAVPYERLVSAIKEAGSDVLEKQWLFDVFAGQGIPEEKHALGIAIQLRKPDSTFTDEEANLVRDRVVAALAELGANTR